MFLLASRMAALRVSLGIGKGKGKWEDLVACGLVWFGGAPRDGVVG